MVVDFKTELHTLFVSLKHVSPNVLHSKFNPNGHGSPHFKLSKVFPQKLKILQLIKLFSIL